MMTIDSGNKALAVRFFNRLPLILACCSLLVTFVIFHLQLGEGFLNDPFHHGEYFAALSSLLHKTDFVPLTIHGALDWLPGLTADLLFGRDHYLFATRLLYIAMQLGCSVTLFLIIRSCVSDGVNLLLASVIIPLVVDYRDFSLLILVALFFRLVATKAPSSISLVMLGMASAINFFFSANRGIAGTVAIGAAILVCSNSRRAILIPASVFVASVLVLSSAHPILNLGNYIENIHILAQTSYQWSYPLAGEALWLTVYIALLLVLTLLLNIVRQWRVGWMDRRQLSRLVAITGLAAFYFQIATYRADFTHITMGLMIVLLNLAHWGWLRRASATEITRQENAILVLLAALSLLILKYDPVLGVLFPLLIVGLTLEAVPTVLDRNWIVGIAATAIGVFFVFKGYEGYNDGGYKWLSSPIIGRSNQSVTTPDIAWVAQRLQQNNVACVFDLTNNGVINAAANKPACTRFSYVVYADRRFEDEIIQALSQTNPSVIVYSTEFWSYRIDGRSMPSRFPKLEARIREVYPKEECSYGYCLRYRL